MRRLKSILKWTLIVFSSLLAILVVVIFVLNKRSYEAPLKTGLKASTDSAVIARGRYLVKAVAHCESCHGDVKLEQEYLAGMDVPMSGGREFKLPIATLYAKNITPDTETGIGSLTDEDLVSTLRYGVGHDGRAVFPFMPFQHLSDEDLVALISYIRAQPAVSNRVPDHSFNPLGYAVRAFLIRPEGPARSIAKTVAPDTSAAYGEYLANSVGNCNGCHTNRDLMTGAFVGEPFAGGFKLEHPDGSYCVSPNLTPHQTTGHLAGWTEQQFIDRFRRPRVIASSEMPWESFKKMTDNDLKAVYRYLQTLKPVENKVGPTYVPPPQAKAVAKS